MTSTINFISADNYFWWSYHFCDVILMPLSGLVVNILVMHSSWKYEFTLPSNIHIAIYIITASIGIKPYISRFSQVKCSILSFYCTVLFTGCSAKKALKSLLHRERLRITQETLQISLFASMFLSLVKKTTLHFLFTVLSYVQGALKKKVWTTYLTEHV